MHRSREAGRIQMDNHLSRPGDFRRYVATITSGKRMKTIGLLGGMSWESTASYYRIINEEVKNKFHLKLFLDFQDLILNDASKTTRVIEYAKILNTSPKTLLYHKVHCLHAMR